MQDEKVPVYWDMGFDQLPWSSFQPLCKYSQHWAGVGFGQLATVSINNNVIMRFISQLKCHDDSFEI